MYQIIRQGTHIGEVLNPPAENSVKRIGTFMDMECAHKRLEFTVLLIAK